jgi:hypothetical protein
MKSSALLTAAAVLLAAPALLPICQGQTAAAAKPAATDRFEQFKGLEGEWTGKSEGAHAGEAMKVIYHVTSGGSAVTETIGPGSDHEMVTIITKDGDNVSLTHYCMMGNQPHMKAAGTGTGNAVAFKFTNGGNMKSDQETHMHSVTYTFVDKDTLKSEWTLYDKGKPTGTVAFLLTRSKK